MKKINTLAFVMLLVAGSIFFFFQTPETGTETTKGQVRTFSSEQDFREYLKTAEESSTYYERTTVPTAERGMEQDLETDAPASGGSGGEKVERYGETNVQVESIDEPDILKTRGRNIFYSSESYWRGNTSIIDGLPADSPSVKSSLKDSGELLLDNTTLLVLKNQEINGYSIENVSEPGKRWNMEFNGSIDTARMYQGDLYVINRQDISYSSPCPIRPLASDSSLSIACTDIYRPPSPVDDQTTYNIMRIDPETGEVEETTSMVVSVYNTVTYMSENAVYLTYTTQNSRAEVMLSYLLDEGSEFLDTETIERLEEIESYDISENSKMNEIQIAVESYLNSLSRDRRLEIESEMENEMREFGKEKMRDFQRTGIVRIGLEDLKTEAEGEVPGTPLNQFSLDEYEDHLRIATTVSGPFGQVETENDLYILDQDLEETGRITGMGLDERVYSARFVGDKGYIVTYRQIDPFHVLDLSDPENPELQGELKLPGYSSYLHPIDDDTVLGIGEEEGNVKIVLFDVSDPENPETSDTYISNEYYSEISQTHHAFMMDRKHEVFFLPGSRGGYVFSYSGGELELEKGVEMNDPNRATYINDYMYILSDTEMVVLDENTWERVSKLEIGQEKDYPIYREEPAVKER